jgi:hypothetical protein
VNCTLLLPVTAYCLLCVQDAFYKAVPPTLLPDYSQVVPPERQMWLERIKQRVGLRQSAVPQHSGCAMLSLLQTAAFHTSKHWRVPSTQLWLTSVSHLPMCCDVLCAASASLLQQQSAV